MNALCFGCEGQPGQGAGRSQFRQAGVTGRGAVAVVHLEKAAGDLQVFLKKTPYEISLVAETFRVLTRATEKDTRVFDSTAGQNKHLRPNLDGAMV
jgi:hypothetical protein